MADKRKHSLHRFPVPPEPEHIEAKQSHLDFDMVWYWSITVKFNSIQKLVQNKSFIKPFTQKQKTFHEFKPKNCSGPDWLSIHNFDTMQRQAIEWANYLGSNSLQSQIDTRLRHCIARSRQDCYGKSWAHWICQIWRIVAGPHNKHPTVPQGIDFVALSTGCELFSETMTRKP